MQTFRRITMPPFPVLKYVWQGFPSVIQGRYMEGVSWNFGGFMEFSQGGHRIVVAQDCLFPRTWRERIELWEKTSPTHAEEQERCPLLSEILQVMEYCLRRSDWLVFGDSRFSRVPRYFHDILMWSLSSMIFGCRSVCIVLLFIMSRSLSLDVSARCCLCSELDGFKSTPEEMAKGGRDWWIKVYYRLGCDAV
jgi:hypothetical protein